MSGSGYQFGKAKPSFMELTCSWDADGKGVAPTEGYGDLVEAQPWWCGWWKPPGLRLRKGCCFHTISPSTFKMVPHFTGEETNICVESQLKTTLLHCLLQSPDLFFLSLQKQCFVYKEICRKLHQFSSLN